MKRLFFLCACVGSCLRASLFGDEGVPAATGGGGMMQTGLMLAVALLFFYFILWRPEQKRRKQMETQRNSLKKGDRVTAMGIVGTVAKIHDTTVVLKMVEGAKVEILKAAITEVQPGVEEVVLSGEPSPVKTD